LFERMRTHEELQIGKPRRHLVDGAHVSLEELAQIAETLGRAVHGVTRVGLHALVHRLFESPPEVIGRAEARREENEIAMLAQDFLPLCFPGLGEPGMKKIETRAAGDVIATDVRKKTFKVPLLSFAPEK